MRVKSAHLYQTNLVSIRVVLQVVCSFVNICRTSAFASNYDYLCNQSLREIYSFRKQIKRTGAMPPTIMFYIFDSVVRPIFAYGSDVWGFNRKCLIHLDKIFLHYARCVLQVKSTTCHTLLNGECGEIPLSVHCQINTICLWNRLANTPANKIVKQVYDEAKRLGDQCFQTWII